MSVVRCQYCGDAFTEPQWPEVTPGAWDKFREELDAHIDECRTIAAEYITVYCDDCGREITMTRGEYNSRNPLGFLLCGQCGR